MRGDVHGADQRRGCDASDELAGLLHARGLRQVTIVEDGKFCGLVGVKQIFGAVIAGRLR